jgi:NAD(P)-dependent dehydrogenase (short-subunit alcohol dehydrogenase family)
MHRLDGRAALITGANQGLGLAIARAYVQSGASVFLCARDAERLKAAQQELVALAMPDQVVLAVPADVSLPAEAQAVAQAALGAFPQLHILVNNAGVYGPKGTLEDVDWDEWVHAIHINLIGSAMLCRAVLPHFRARGYGKIVQLSGGGATNPLPRLSAYAASKAAVVRLAETLAEETRGVGIDVNAIAPGALNTRLLDEVLQAGPEKVGTDFYARAVKQQAEGGASLETAARLAVFLGSAASDGITGRLLSAVWDNWSALPARLTELRASDVFTLRRITPKDRGLDWE